MTTIGSINFGPAPSLDDCLQIVHNNIIKTWEAKYADMQDAHALAIQSQKNKIDSLTAAINYAINEFPSSPASQYLRGVMEGINKGE